MTAADLIVTGARVLTMDGDRPRAEAVAVRGGRIVAVGSAEDLGALGGPATEVIEARGATLLPGFVESHCHLFLGGAELGDLQIGGVAGFDAAAERIRAFAAEHPDRAMLMAHGADYDLLGHPTTRRDLDRILPDRAFAMTSGDRHTVWANTPALEAAGLLHGAPTPPGARVVMGEDGLATGELREPPSFAPIMALAGVARAGLGLATGEEPDPAPSPAERAADRDILARAAAHLAAQGITSAVNMDGNRYTLELLGELLEEGRLPLRVTVPFHFKPHMDLAALDRAAAMAREWRGDRLRSGFVKMFMDGVVDSRTAVMLEDYPDRPGWRGEPLFEADRFARIATEADRRGLQIAVHAIGDGAVRRVLDGYARAREANGPRDARHRIEHIELIDRADLPRLRALGVVASVQPPHPPGAMDFPLHPTVEIIGRDRWADAYPWRTLAEAGAPLVFASDWPVADVSVLRGIKAAATRRPWADDLRDERIGLMPTLAAYTRGGAWAAHAERRIGILRPGHLADMVLLSGDIEATAPDEIDRLEIALTVCDGRITHRGPTATTG